MSFEDLKNFSSDVPQLSSSQINRMFSGGRFGVSNKHVTCEYIQSGSVELMDICKEILLRFGIDCSQLKCNQLEEDDSYSLHDDSMYFYANMSVMLNLVMPKINRGKYYLNLLINPKWPQTKLFLEQTINYFLSLDRDMEVWSRFQAQIEAVKCEGEDMNNKLRQIEMKNNDIEQELQECNFEGVQTKQSECTKIEENYTEILKESEAKKNQCKDDSLKSTDKLKQLTNVHDGLLAKKELISRNIVLSPEALLVKLKSKQDGLHKADNKLSSLTQELKTARDRKTKITDNLPFCSILGKRLATIEDDQQTLVENGKQLEMKKLEHATCAERVQYLLQDLEAQAAENEDLERKLKQMRQRSHDKVLSTIGQIENWETDKAKAEQSTGANQRRCANLLTCIKQLREEEGPRDQDHSDLMHNIADKKKSCADHSKRTLDKFDNTITLVKKSRQAMN